MTMWSQMRLDPDELFYSRGTTYKPECYSFVYLSFGDGLQPGSTVSVQYVDRLSHSILVDVSQHETRCFVQQQHNSRTASIVHPRNVEIEQI